MRLDNISSKGLLALTACWSDSFVVSVLKHEGAIWFPNKELATGQHHPHYKKHLELCQGRHLNHLNTRNKLKKTCQEKDTQNTKDKVSPCFPRLEKKIDLPPLDYSMHQRQGVVLVMKSWETDVILSLSQFPHL